MDSRIELAIDCYILDRSTSNLDAMNVVLRSVPYPTYASELVFALTQGARDLAVPSLVSLDSFLTSRMLRQGFTPPLSVEEAMYRIADAARALAPVDLLRWRYVLECVSKELPLDAVDRLLRQSLNLLETLTELLPDDRFQWEQQVLYLRHP